MERRVNHVLHDEFILHNIIEVACMEYHRDTGRVSEFEMEMHNHSESLGNAITIYYLVVTMTNTRQ